MSLFHHENRSFPTSSLGQVYILTLNSIFIIFSYLRLLIVKYSTSKFCLRDRFDNTCMKMKKIIVINGLKHRFSGYIFWRKTSDKQIKLQSFSNNVPKNMHLPQLHPPSYSDSYPMVLKERVKSFSFKTFKKIYVKHNEWKCFNVTFVFMYPGTNCKTPGLRYCT